MNRVIFRDESAKLRIDLREASKEIARLLETSRSLSDQLEACRIALARAGVEDPTSSREQRQSKRRLRLVGFESNTTNTEDVGNG